MVSLIDLLALSVASSWPCYTPVVEIVNYAANNYSHIGAAGECPHGHRETLFSPVTSGYYDAESRQVCNGAQCQACKDFVLVVGWKPNGHNKPADFLALFPVGKPNDSVDPAIPESIASDFREALRCRWIEAHKATVVMCRRALQSSCHAKGAKTSKLIDQIDELTNNGTITVPLKEFAHEIRLEGNDGAHPAKDGLDEVTPEDADDVLEFTRHFLEHVFIMPAKLRARKPTTATSATS